MTPSLRPRSRILWRHLRRSCAAYSSSSPSSTTAVQFYQNKQLESYAARRTNPLTLRQLVFFGRSLNEQRLIKSANYLRVELPIRIAHRLRDLQALPYIVVTQESVAQVYELYWTAFEKFRRFPPIRNLEENQKFCDFCKALLKEHINAIPHLALGMILSSPHLEPEQLDSFMRRMLVSRISRRVLVEHHVALTETFGNGCQEPERRGVGIISTNLNPREILDKCVMLLRQHPRLFLSGASSTKATPQILVDGQINMQFAYISKHLEYILFELLKNAMQAVLSEHHSSDLSDLPPIRITMAAGPNYISIRLSDQGGGIKNLDLDSSAGLFSFSHARNPSRLSGDRLGALRSISERPQGLTATLQEQIMLSDSVDHEASGQAAHPRLGIGLPMSNVYATYFGGSLRVVSLDGWGTDVYLRLPKLGTSLEGIEV